MLSAAMAKVQHRILLNGVTTYYEDASPPSPHGTLVIVHGWAASRVLWRSLQKKFAESMRVVIYDLRGHGDAGKPEGVSYDIATFAQDLKALLDALNIERTHLLGHSMGGLVCQEFAARYPDRVDHLVLSGTSLGLGDVKAPEAQDMLDMLRNGGYQDFIAYGADMWFASEVDAKTITASRTAMQRCPEHVAVAAMEALLGYTSRDKTQSIAAPTLVIGGGEDALQGRDAFEALAVALPHGQLRLLESVGHDAYLEAPDDYTNAIAEFLGSVD